MIKFALACENGHRFDSWFQSGAAYEIQVESGFVGCPVCGTTSVTKALMTPAIAARRRDDPIPAKAPERPQAPAQMALLDDKDRELRTMIEGLRQRIFEVAEDVGDRFPEEARKIHDGRIPDRPIHGQASPEEARTLIEEGVGILPIPVLPDEQN